MATSYDVIARAAKEIGYSRFTDPLMGTIYGRWYALLTNTPWFGTNGVPYCAMFVSYILAECGVEVPGFPTASCLTALSGARNAGIVLANKYDARPGDIVLFDWDPQSGNGVDHVGFVERNCGSYIQTIEGNTSPGTSGSQGNGGGVHRRTRSWGVVAAIIRPNYDGVPSSSKSEAGGGISEDGWWGQATTAALQRALGAVADGEIWHQWPDNRSLLRGCTSGWSYDYTGEGSPTIKALQRNYLGTKADGLVGVNTINAMIRRYGNGYCDGVLDGPSTAIRGLQHAINAGHL